MFFIPRDGEEYQLRYCDSLKHTREATPHTNNFLVDIHKCWVGKTCSNNLDHSRIACSGCGNMTGKLESHPHRHNTPLFLSRHLSSNYIATRNSTMDCNMPPTTNEEFYSSQHCTKFSNLPLDVILAIAECLPASSVTCLALTCKQLYYSEPLHTVYTKNLDPFAFPNRCPNRGDDCYPAVEEHSHDHLDLVRMLRKDLPEHLLCEFCQKFHPKPIPKVSRPRSDWLYCPTVAQTAVWLRWPYFRVHLQFEDVQMVMNRYRWGGSHGAPLSSISIDQNWEVLRCAVPRLFLAKFGLEPEIVDGNLLIHTTERVFFATKQLQDSLPEIKRRYWIDVFSSCRHKSAIRNLRKGVDDVLSFCTERATTRFASIIHCGTRETWKKSDLSQCPDCAACSCVEIAYHNGRSELRQSGDKKYCAPVHGIELIVHSWMHLGECEHTFSPSWLNLCSSNGQLYPEYLYKEAMDLNEAFRNERLREARTRYDGIALCSSTLERPSLLPSIKYAVAMYPFEAKQEEISKILRGSIFVSYDILQVLVEDELGYSVTSGNCLSQAETEVLSRAREFIREYRRNTAPEPRWRLWAWLCSNLFNKLTFGLLTGRSSVDPDEVYKKVRVWPWDRSR